MSSPDETVAIEPLLSAEKLEKVRAIELKAVAQSTDNPTILQAYIEKAARSKISNQAELYRSLVRALRRRRGFGILFLQCTPAKGKEIFSRLQTDLPQKQIGRLTLTEPIENLKTLIEARTDLNELNVLFIEGIEHSLLPYIESEIGRNDYYKLEVLPPILDHLNLYRENFRNQFGHLCLVFVVPSFALKYFMYRAVDFFSWHSGIWTFSPPEKELAKEMAKAVVERVSEYAALSNEEKNRKLIQLQGLADVKNQPDELRAYLLFKQAAVFIAIKNWDAAIRCFDEMGLTHNENDKTHFVKGLLLTEVGRHEDAVAVYDAVLSIEPDKQKAQYFKGISLSALGKFKDAITAYNAALTVEPNEHEIHFLKGVAFSALGQVEDAITAYDTALAIEPDKHEAHHFKGMSLAALDRNEEAIIAYDAALAIKPDKHEAHYKKAYTYALLNESDNAIMSLQKALVLDKTEKSFKLAQTDPAFDAIRDRPEFQAIIAQYEETQHSEK